MVLIRQSSCPAEDRESVSKVMEERWVLMSKSSTALHAKIGCSSEAFLRMPLPGSPQHPNTHLPRLSAPSPSHSQQPTPALEIQFIKYIALYLRQASTLEPPIQSQHDICPVQSSPYSTLGVKGRARAERKLSLSECSRDVLGRGQENCESEDSLSCTGRSVSKK